MTKNIHNQLFQMLQKIYIKFIKSKEEIMNILYQKKMQNNTWIKEMIH